MLNVVLKAAGWLLALLAGAALVVAPALLTRSSAMAGVNNCHPASKCSSSSTTTTSSTSTTTTSTTITLTGSQEAQLQGNTYHLQANEWGSSAPFAITNTDGNPDFTVSKSQLNNTGGTPGAYPSLYKGCHWNSCTASSNLPLHASTVEAGGHVTSSETTTPPSSGAWDDAYDIWWNSAQSGGCNSCGSHLEMMIWLGHTSAVNPCCTEVAANVPIGGYTYNVFVDGSIVVYALARPATAISFDLGPIAADATARGYLPSGWWLLDIESGFEIWQGGVGAQVNAFDVTASP
jgi:Glycosyl hydrolase family 12